MTFVSRFTKAAAVGGVLALALAGCSSGNTDSTPGTSGESSTSNELTTLKVMVSGSVGDGALLGGMEQGFFEEEGLELDVTISPNPPAAMAAVQSGEVEIVMTPTIPYLTALSQGISAITVAPMSGFPAENQGDYDDTLLLAHPDRGITSIEDLAGKTVSVPARKAMFEIVIQNALEGSNVTVDDINWVTLDFASAASALREGTVDATVLPLPFSVQALAAGAVEIAKPISEFVGEGSWVLWLTGANTAESKKSEIASFQRAMRKSNEWANENPEVASQVALDFLESPLAVEDIAVPYWPLSVSVEELERLNKRLVELGAIENPADLTNVIFEG